MEQANDTNEIPLVATFRERFGREPNIEEQLMWARVIDEEEARHARAVGLFISIVLAFIATAVLKGLAFAMLVVAAQIYLVAIIGQWKDRRCQI
jgi:fatty acid desaturase